MSRGPAGVGPFAGAAVALACLPGALLVLSALSGAAALPDLCPVQIGRAHV